MNLKISEITKFKSKNFKGFQTQECLNNFIKNQFKYIVNRVSGNVRGTK